MFVVPRAEQWNQDPQDTVAFNFFRTIFPDHGPKVQYSLMAFSALGNIIVQTFTAARVKQEIAKEGILPPRAVSRFFAENYSPRQWLRPKERESSTVAKSEKTAPEHQGSEDTPAAAFLLHWTFAVILILATAPLKGDSYRILVNVYSYVVNVVFGVLLGVGLLVLRFKKDSEWSNISKTKPWISITTTLIFVIGNLFPLVAVWIPPTQQDHFFDRKDMWFVVGTVGAGVMALGALWWMSIRFVIPQLTGKELETDREYDFIRDNGAWVMWNEVVSIQWRSSQGD